MGGICFSTNDSANVVKTNQQPSERTSKQQSKGKDKHKHKEEKDKNDYESLMNSLPENFKDFPYLEEEKFICEGVKRDKAFTSHMLIDKLNDLRDEYLTHLLAKGFVKEEIKVINLICRTDYCKCLFVIVFNWQI